MSLSSPALADAVPAVIAAVHPMDVPVGWSDPDSVNVVHALLVLGGIPLVLFLLIGLAVYVPALARGERIAPGAQPLQNHWIGGPRTGVAELNAPASDASESQSGGASGRW